MSDELSQRARAMGARIAELESELAEARASRERLRIVLAAIDDSDLDIVTFDTMWALLLPADLEPYK